MRAIPYWAISLFAVLQALVTVYWRKTNAPQLTQAVFDSFHGGLPAWSVLAFSLGWYWIFLPLAGLVWLLLAWRRPRHRRYAWLIAAVSLLSLFSMIYAMYPIHIIAAGYSYTFPKRS